MPTWLFPEQLHMLLLMPLVYIHGCVGQAVHLMQPALPGMCKQYQLHGLRDWLFLVQLVLLLGVSYHASDVLPV